MRGWQTLVRFLPWRIALGGLAVIAGPGTDLSKSVHYPNHAPISSAR
jgi:hypothetical protein